jgi:hypothetical protein
VNPSLLKGVGIGLLHFAVATVGVSVGSALVFYSLKPLLYVFMSNRTVNSDTVLWCRFFPFQALVAFACSWHLARRGGRAGATSIVRLLWIVPCVWLLFLIVVWHHQSLLRESRWQHFFWSRSTEALRIQMVSTLPLITTLAYALGNYCGASNPGQNLAGPN